MLLLKTSSARQNNKGDRRSPHLTPLLQLKNPWPTLLIEAKGRGEARGKSSLNPNTKSTIEATPFEDIDKKLPTDGVKCFDNVYLEG